MIKVGEICGKYVILIVEEKRISLIRNKTKINLWNDSKTTRVRGNIVEGAQDMY